MPLTPGQQLGSYEIVASLGAGGMGEVYRARDSRLGRDVALKVLPPEVTGEPGRLERFDREARAIAALNHPHIVTIYSTEEADGIRFLTMELVDGCTLSDLILSSGMAVTRFLDIAIPLADALAAAHQKQITHRDLKPGNVMVSNDGRVKVLDFGLARVDSSAASEETLIATRAPITHHGTIVGTMPYMSPEQVEGRPLDPRSDLFSLGVMFYELLSGERPFKGSSSPALMSAILRDTPSSIGERRADLSESLTRLVDRLLEKRPEDRWQTARDVFNELRHVKRQQDTGSSSTRRPSDRSMQLSVRVLPFTARGGDDDTAALAEALPGEIANGLSRFGYVRVLIGEKSPAQARYALEGQLRKAGPSIRISVKLVNAATNDSLWSQNFDRQITGDFFALQDDIANRVVTTVGDPTGILARAMLASIADVAIDQLNVAELVIRYHAYSERFGAEEHGVLRDALEHALKREPRAAEGWACLAQLYRQEYSHDFNPREDPLPRQRRAAERAVELDPNSQLAWVSQSSAHLFARDGGALRFAVDRAVALNPLNAIALSLCGLYMSVMGDHDRAVSLATRAAELKPQPPGWNHIPPFARHFVRGDYERALLEAKAINLPRFAFGQIGAAAAAAMVGKADEARSALRTIHEHTPERLDPERAREAFAKWVWDESFIDSVDDGFRKALDLIQDPEARSDVRSGARSKPPSSASSATSQSSGLTLAVLPFVPRSSDDESKSLAEGLTDDITSGLSRFGYLRVLSRSIAEKLGRGDTNIRNQVRYTIEGQVRKSGPVFRTGVTLVDIETGTNLWTTTYDREAGAGMLAVQDEVASAAVATIGDQTGVLVRAIAASIAETPIDQLTIAELVIRYHLYTESFHPEEHARLRDAFERRLEREPRAAEGWACLAMLCEQEHGLQLNPLPDSRGRQRRAANRSVELDPRCQMGWIAMASVQVFARDREALKAAVERSVSINPLNADLMALGGLFLSMAGEFERAHALVMTAVARKPQHPFWYHFPLTNYHIARGDYETALRENKAVNMPRMALMHLAAAAISGHLGRTPEAKAAFEGLRNVAPALVDPANARASWAVWFWSDEFIDTMLEGFTRAKQLAEDPPDGRSNGRSDDRSTDVLRSTEQSIAVLPFNDLSEKKDQDWFCDGIAEELLNALAPLPGLRVAARASAFSFRGKTEDLRVIADKLNVDTVLEGSVRRAGDRVRITTQLSDARQGRQMWSERFDREMKDIFDVQEEIARAIVERLRMTLGAEARLVQKPTANLDAYQLLLKGRTFLARRGPAVLTAITCFEQAIALDPNLAGAYAGIGDAQRLLSIYGLMPSEEVMPKARAALERALELDPDQPDALATLANIKFAYEWDFAESRRLTDRALAVDPMHARALAESAITIATAMAEPPSEGLTAFVLTRIALARKLDPLNAWVMAIESITLTLLGRLADAEAPARSAVATDPNNFTAHWALVVALASLGKGAEMEQAAVIANAMSGRHANILTQLAAFRAAHGDKAGAAAIYEEMTERKRSAYVSNAAMAVVAAAAEQYAEARTMLAKAIDVHEAYLTFIKLSAWRPVWNDPGCAELLRGMAYYKNAIK